MTEEPDKLGGASIGNGVHPELITIGNPILRRKSKPVTDFQFTVPLCNHLVELLRDIKGAGLAACQIDSPWSIFIVEVRKTEIYPNRPESPLYVMINPLITEYSSSKTTDWEGCFSVPGLMGQVPRFDSLTVKYFDVEGNEHDERFEGYIARVIQHEYDHLEGMIYLDRIESTRSITTVANFKRFYLA